MVKRSLYIAIAILALYPSRASAWGDLGHKIICEVAFQLVKPDVRYKIVELMKGDPQFKLFRDSCTYADCVRNQRRIEHYVNLPRTATGLTSATCPLAPRCVVSAIREDFGVLSSDAPDEQKLEALKFLSHWVGDVHQPMHVSFVDDVGGNLIKVNGECSRNLHAAWDTCLVEELFSDDPIAAATELIRGVTPSQQHLWTQSLNAKEWADETFAITRAPQTKYCEQRDGECKRVEASSSAFSW